MPRKRLASDDQILSFIAEYHERYGCAPSYCEVMEGLGYKSKATVSKRLARMRRDGKVSYSDGKQRTLRVSKGYNLTRTDVRVD